MSLQLSCHQGWLTRQQTTILKRIRLVIYADILVRSAENLCSSDTSAAAERRFFLSMTSATQDQKPSFFLLGWHGMEPHELPKCIWVLVSMHHAAGGVWECCCPGDSWKKRMQLGPLQSGILWQLLLFLWLLPCWACWAVGSGLVALDWNRWAGV